MDVSCHRPFLPGTSLEPAVIPTAQASSFTLQYFPYYVWLLPIIIIIIIITEIQLSLGGSSPYTSTDKTNKNKYT